MRADAQRSALSRNKDRHVARADKFSSMHGNSESEMDNVDLFYDTLYNTGTNLRFCGD
jgi:hypothetical protein